MAKIDHYCSWCGELQFSEEREDFDEDTETHSMCEGCELKLLNDKLPQIKAKLEESKDNEVLSTIIAGKIEKMENRIKELEDILQPTTNEAADSIFPVATMRFSKISDPNKFLRKASLTPDELLLALRPPVTIQPMRGDAKAPVVPANLNFDPELGFKVMSSLESNGKSWARGDSGNSFGLTQVHGPYFMKWLSRHPQLQRATGIDPKKLAAMSNSWKANMRSMRKEDIWKTVPVDQNAVKDFMRKNPRKVVRRREGTSIRMNPGALPGIVKKIGNQYVGKEIDIKMLEDKYGFKPTAFNMARLQKVTDTYITSLVAKSALAQLLTAQEHPETSAKFYTTFASGNVRKNTSIKNLSNWVSRSDFMAKMRFLVNDVIKYGYNPTVPGAYNMYQLMCITNGSGPYRVRRFLKNKKTFGPAHVHYLQRANRVIQKMTGQHTNVIEGGLAGFPDLQEKRRYAFLSKKGQDDLDMPDGFDMPDSPEAPPEHSGRAGAIKDLVEKWINGEADLSEMSQYGISHIGKNSNDKVVHLTMSENDIRNIKPFMPNKIAGYTIHYQVPLTSGGPQIETHEVIEENMGEFSDEPTKVDPLKGIGTKYFREISQEFDWYKDHMDEVLEDLKSRYGREFTNEEAKSAIVNTIVKKYEHLTSNTHIRIVLQKYAQYAEPGTMYFPGQYAEDIKSGKRTYTIRPGDVNVKPDEQVKCKSYSGADIADVKILKKKVMSIIRIEKAYGKSMAKSLSSRFGPDKRFVIIEFEPISINTADDEKNISEVLIDKDKKQSLDCEQDTAENNYVNAPLWETKYDYNDPEVPFPEGNIVQITPPQGSGPYDQHGAYNTVDDAFALSKRHNIKKKATSKVDKEYIWLWDETDNRFISHLNISDGQRLETYYDHLTLGKHNNVNKITNDGWRGRIFIYADPNDPADVQWYGDRNLQDEGPTSVIKGINNILGKEGVKKFRFEKIVGWPSREWKAEKWKTNEKDRLLKKHLEKMHQMGKEGPDPEFVEDLNRKFASKVAILVSPTEFCEEEYVTSLRVFAEKYGFEVQIVSSSDTSESTDGVVIMVDEKLLNMNADTYDALFVCGGKGMTSFSKNKEAQQLLRDFVEQEKPVGMICHGPLLAAEANVINGCEMTGGPDIVGRIKRAKGLWTGMPIERSGCIFTAVGSEETEVLAHIISNFLLGGEVPKNKMLSEKMAKAKLERLWKLAEDLDDDKVKKFLEEHPEFEEEEEPEEIETEQERLDRAVTLPPPQKPEDVEVPEEMEPEEDEEEDKSIQEDVLRGQRPKYVGFRHIVKPEDEEDDEKDDEVDYSSLLGDEDDGDLWDDALSEYKETEGGDEDEDITNKIPVFGVKLQPPRDKKGVVLSRWFEPEEIEKPVMSPQAKDLFTPDNMKDGPSLTKLFQDPSAWAALKENPEIAQKWVLPAIIMGVGKRWFDNNSTQLKLGAKGRDVGRTPFGMFDVGDFRLLSKGTAIVDLPSSKAYISLVNEVITELANTYFSFGYRVDPPRGSLPLGGYIYKALSREMSKNIAADKGYKEIRVPVCSYCKSRKQKRQSKDVVYHAMEPVREGGSKLKQWYCEECRRVYEENKGLISELKHDMASKQEEIGKTQEKLNEVAAQLISNPTSELEEQKKGYEEIIISLAGDVKHSRIDLENFGKKQYSLKVHSEAVPYWHTWCPNSGCPGNRVPMTALDQKHEFWQTDAGAKAMEVLKKRFNITVAPSQEAVDDEEEPMPNILPQRIPPDELLDVPFICPHDYVKFTLRSAKGKGLSRKGGYFWEPWQHMKWDQVGKEEIGVEEEGMGGVEADQEKNMRQQTTQRTMMYLSVLGAKIFSDQYDDAIKGYNNWFTKQIEIHRERGKTVRDAVKKVEQSKTNGAKQRLLSMYQTLGETSHLDPGMFISWLGDINVNSEFVKDEDGNIEQKNITEKITAKDRRDNVYVPALHSWVSKMMESRDDWFEHYHMEDILANPKADGLYSNGPGTFFIVKVGDEIAEDNSVVFGFGCNLVPAHTESSSYNPYGGYRPSKENDFSLPRRNPKKKPIRDQASLKPKVLKFIGLWKISSEQMGFVGKHPEWMDGSAPVPMNNKLVEYAQTNPEDNLAGEIMYGDFYRVGLNKADTSFGIGEYILVQALIMPGKYNPEPVVDIRNIRNKSDTHQNIFSKVGALMNEQHIDPGSEALLREFFEDIQNYGDDPEEMLIYMEDLVRGFEELKKKKASFQLSVRTGNSNKKTKGSFLLSKRAGQTYTEGDMAYSVDMLIEIAADNKIEEVPVSSIEWNMKEDVWGSKHSPEDVLKNPKKYKDDAKGIKDAELKHPILLYKGKIIDGYHRLAKAVMQNKKTIKAIVLTKKQIDAARIDEERKKELV